MNNIKAIFIKQLVNQIKVPAIIIYGFMFLAIAVVFAVFLSEDEEEDCYSCVPAYVCGPCEEEAYERFELPIPSGIGLFAVMFIGLGLLSSVSAIIMEEKTTKNLQFMKMADVKPYQYLLGSVPSIIIIVTGVFAFYAFFHALFYGSFGIEMLWFMALGITGGLVSILFGLVIGLSKFPLLATPICIVLGLGPTMAPHNEALARVLSVTFVQQVNLGIAELDSDLTSNFMIIAANGLVALILFGIMHRKNKFNV